MPDFGEFQSARAATAVSRRPGSGSWALTRLRKLFGAFNIYLWIFVFFPTLVAGVYYFGIASDQYLSEAKFVVRTKAGSQTTGLGSLLQTTGLSRSQDDAALVHDFVLSRDGVQALEQNDHLREVFNRPGADFLTRFPGPFGGDSFERLYKHFQDFVSISTDGSTGVSTLRVLAYNPQDAQSIATAALGYSEKLVNKLNDRAERDAVASAQREVDLGEQRIMAIQEKLTSYRLREQMLDPKSSSSGYLDTLKQVTGERVRAATQLSELEKNAPANPQVNVLRTRIAALDNQIASADQKISGSNGSVVTKQAEYDHLTLERELAEKSLEVAFQSLQIARTEAQRQQLYIEHVVQPNLADFPLYPRRFLSFFMVAVTCLIAYGTAWLLIAGVREHAAA